MGNSPIKELFKRQNAAVTHRENYIGVLIINTAWESQVYLYGQAFGFSGIEIVGMNTAASHCGILLD